jgi:HEAT repeat protein
MRFSAASALRKIGPDAHDALSALIEASKDSDPVVREYAFEALSSIGTSDEVIPVLIAALWDEGLSHPLVIGDIVSDLLGENKDAVPALMTALQTGNDKVKLRAIKALGKIGQDAQDAIPLLLPYLKYPDSDFRFYADYSLSEITGQDFGQDFSKWEEWWNQQKK